MIDRRWIWLAAGLMLAATLPVGADAPAPTRHLVYDFTYGSSSDQTIQTAGISANGMGTQGGAGASASGVADTRSGIADDGTITVDVLVVQPDTGLVVTVTEAARNDRSAPTAECVVYSNTNVVCDPNKRVNAEEQVLLRLLGSHLVDPDQLDDKNHWQIQHSDSDGVLTDDFTIEKNDNGLMQIQSERLYKTLGAHIATTSSDTKIDYDFNRTVPTSIGEETITREEQGMGNYNTTTVQTTLKLQQDSLAKP